MSDTSNPNNPLEIPTSPMSSGSPGSAASQVVPPPPPPAAYVPTPPPQFYGTPPAAPPAAFKKPVVAGLLSALPGVGHLYLGLYQRAAIFFTIWVVIIALVDRSHHGPIGIFIPFWWFFVLIDAVRQAHAINATGAPLSNLVTGEKPIKIQGNLAFGVFLILIGAFFLIDRLVTIDLTWLIDWWPAAVILFGAWQVFTYYKAKQPAEAAKL